MSGEDNKSNDLIRMETTPEIDHRELIPISHKDFNEFIKGREFMRRNDDKLKQLKAMFGV